MAVKGFYDNPQEATTPASTDLLGIQQGNTLADMKKITYENLVKPLDEAKLDKIATPTENAIVVQNADGTLKNSNVNITDPTFDSVGADEFDTGSQVVEAAMIPSTTDEMLRLKNTQAGKVHTIMELRSPDTGDTEATLSLHTVPNGTDDWVFDLSFHNYTTFMKMVSVISHFTGENAGSWEWVSRYTDGTDYSMIERMLMKLDGQTGYLMVGENGDATARFHAKQVGYLDKPAIKAEVDSTHETQPPALHATDTTNHAQAGVLVKFSMLNATDTGIVLKLENAGTGAYINADDKFVVDKDGNITSPTIEAIKGTGYTEGSLKTHEDRLDTLEGTGAGSVAKAIDDALEPIEARVDTTELTLARQGQDLASVKQTLQQGNGATLDFSGIGSVTLDARATGRANPTVEGRTATNLATDGSVEVGFGNFIVQSTSRSTTKAYDGQYSAYLPLGSSYVRLNLSGNDGDKFLLLYAGYKVASGTMAMAWQDNAVVTDGTLDTWKVLTYIRTYSSTATKQYVNFFQSGGECYYDAFRIINLTSIYGSGNEPSASDCAKIFRYFDGTKSIQMPARVRSVGKNIARIESDNLTPYYNPLYLPDAYSYSLNEITVRQTTAGAYRGIAVVLKTPPLTQVTLKRDIEYIVEGSHLNSGHIRIQDSSGITIGTLVRGATEVSFTTPSDGYLKLSFLATWVTSEIASYRWYNIQLELGSTATSYEPYQNSTLYIADDKEGRSVPAVKDQVKVVNGEYIYTKKVSTPVSVLSGVAVNVTNYPLAKTGGKFAVELTAGGTQIGVIGTDSTSGAGMLRYELATPVTTNLLTSGILQAKPKGTVYFEPYYEGSHQTNASSQITLPYTGTIDKLTGYDENLEPYEIPSTGYTLVGTTLTITGAVENEVYYVEMQRAEPLAPEMEVNVLNNDQVTLDTVNGKYYKITFTTANGVPTTVATEVV